MLDFGRTTFGASCTGMAKFSWRLPASRQPAPSKRSMSAPTPPPSTSPTRSNSSTPTATAFRCRPRRAPTASSGASRCARAKSGSNWGVFALANNGDEQIDRLIVAPHYRMVGSGLIWPDLGLSRIVYITPSSGDPPDRQDNAGADVFRITLDPGTVITFVAELRTDNLPQIYLWEPDAYKDKLNSLTLYQGIVIGIAGLLALFLTILFVVKGSVMFPAAAALGWAVLIYIGIDFGFWPKVFDMSSGAERIWRASGEAILAATLLVFLFAYLNLNRWHVRYAHITVGWLAFLGALVAVALFSPAVASGIARISLFLVAVLGFALVVYLSTHDFDRAVMLIPTWLLLLVWTIGAALTVLGFVTNDIIGPALLGGLVLIVMLIGFTVMQHAFAGGMAQRHRLRRRTPRAGAHRRRRHDLGLGRLLRQGLHQPGNRDRARPQGRLARRAGGEVARSPPRARPRPLPRHPRQRARAAARPRLAGLPHAHGRRPLSVVRTARAAGGRV